MKQADLSGSVKKIIQEAIQETYEENGILSPEDVMSMDSMSMMYIVCRVEDEFHISIPDSEWKLVKSADDVVALVKKYYTNRE